MPCEQRQEHAGKQSKAMEHRQRAKERPVRLKRHVRVGLLAIGDDICMRQHRALGRAVRARGKQDDASIVGIGLGREQARREALQQRDDLVAEIDALAHIFQINQLRVLGQFSGERLKLGELDKALRGKNFLDVRGVARGAQIHRACREIQHGRGAADGLQREEGHRRPHARGQHYAGRLSSLDDAIDLAAERESGADDVIVRENLAFVVL